MGSATGSYLGPRIAHIGPIYACLLCQQEHVFSRSGPVWLIFSTVLPAKSDSDVMFCLHRYQGLIIDRSLVCWSYPQDRINTQVIYRFVLAQMDC